MIKSLEDFRNVILLENGWTRATSCAELEQDPVFSKYIVIVEKSGGAFEFRPEYKHLEDMRINEFYYWVLNNERIEKWKMLK